MHQLMTSNKGKDSSRKRGNKEQTGMSSMLHFIDSMTTEKQLPSVHSQKQAVSVYEWDYWPRYWCSCHPSPEPSSSSCWKQICHPETVIELTSHSLSVPFIKRKRFCSWSSFGLGGFPALRSASFGWWTLLPFCGSICMCGHLTCSSHFRNTFFLNNR